MKNDVTTTTPKALVRELEAIRAITDKDELRRLLVQTLSVTVMDFIRLAAVVRRAEELGDDLSDMEISLVPQLRRIAYDQMLPEVLVRFQGNLRVLRKVASLPLPDQRRIVDGEPCKVMLLNGDHRLVSPLNLTGREVSQVFGPDGLRHEGEQLAYLRERQERQPVRLPQSEVIVDYKHRCILVTVMDASGRVLGEKSLPVAELLRYASELSALKQKG